MSESKSCCPVRLIIRSLSKRSAQKDQLLFLDAFRVQEDAFRVFQRLILVQKKRRSLFTEMSLHRSLLLLMIQQRTVDSPVMEENVRKQLINTESELKKQAILGII